MEKEIVIDENKVLKYDEKSVKDTQQLLSEISEQTFDNFYERFSNVDDINIIKNLFSDRGKKLYLEVTVEDSYMSGSISSWLYRKSLYDDTSGLRVLGCRLNAVHFSIPNSLTEEEIEAIRILSKRVE